MKMDVHDDRKVIERKKRLGIKTRSHGSYRAKRKPNSPRVK